MAKRSPSAGNSRNRSRSRSKSPRRTKTTTRRVVIANIPYNITWNKLKQVFRDELGFAGYLRLMKTNGRPNGMGLMEFKSVEGAQKAIDKMHRFQIGDRQIIVRDETIRDQQRMATMEFDGPSEPGMEGGMLPPTPQPGPVMPPQMRGNGGNAMPGAMNLTPNVLESMGVRLPITDTLYISNLDYSVDWRKLKDLCKGAGRVIHATIKQGDDGRSKGVASVRFEHPYEALLAWSMFNGVCINDRPMRIKIDRDGVGAPSHLPVFPNTPQGAAAAASFMANFNQKGLGDNAGANIGNNGQAAGGMPYNGPPGPVGGFMGQMQPQQQPMMPQQAHNQPGNPPAIAAAMAALIGGGGGVGNRQGMPQGGPSGQDLIGGLLGAASSNGNAGVGGFQGNQFGQFMGGGYGGAGDRPLDGNAAIQQLAMAATHGGMTQEQVAQLLSKLNYNNRDAPAMPSFATMGGMMNQPGNGGDLYGGDRGGMDMARPRGGPVGSNFDSRPRFRDNGDSRIGGGPGGFRHGDSSRSAAPRGGGMSRPDGDRMYMRR